MTTSSKEYLRGFNCAKKELQTVDAKELRGQASSDLYPDDFTKGWKAACDEVAEERPKTQKDL